MMTIHEARLHHKDIEKCYEDFSSTRMIVSTEEFGHEQWLEDDLMEIERKMIAVADKLGKLIAEAQDKYERRGNL